MFLKGAELAHGQVMSESARAAVGEERDAAVAQAETPSGGAGGIVVRRSRRFRIRRNGYRRRSCRVGGFSRRNRDLLLSVKKAFET